MICNRPTDQKTLIIKKCPVDENNQNWNIISKMLIHKKEFYSERKREILGIKHKLACDFQWLQYENLIINLNRNCLFSRF